MDAVQDPPVQRDLGGVGQGPGGCGPAPSEETWPDYKKGDFDWNNIKWNPREDPRHDAVDHWGCVWKTSDFGFVGTVFEHPLADISKLEEIEIPDAAHYNGGMLPVADWERVRKNLEAMKERGDFAQGGLNHGFHMLRLEYLRGFENLMMDLTMDTPEINRLAGILHDLNKVAVRNWIAAGADLILLPEDLGTQTSSILGPKLFRKWVLPYHKELHDMCHAAGALTYFHSDGNIMDVADQILEIGADVINNQDLGEWRGQSGRGVQRAGVHGSGLRPAKRAALWQAGGNSRTGGIRGSHVGRARGRADDQERGARDRFRRRTSMPWPVRSKSSARSGSSREGRTGMTEDATREPTDIERLAELIRAYSPVVALTGAGDFDGERHPRFPFARRALRVGGPDGIPVGVGAGAAACAVLGDVCQGGSRRPRLANPTRGISRWRALRMRGCCGR